MPLRRPLAAALLAGALAPALAAQQTIGGCQVLPDDSVWNTPVASLPVLPNSTQIVGFVNTHCSGGGCTPRTTLKADFGSGLWQGAPIGIPYVAVPAGQTPVPIDFSIFGWPDESDPGPYPIPANAPIEGGPGSDGDRHVLVVRQGTCDLYELYYSWPEGQNGCVVPGSPPGWCGASGAVYDLGSNALRPDGWTSADAAGLPILPGLARFEEVQSGEIRHALRFTASVTRDLTWVWPARHEAGSSTNANAPRMGERLRLRADYPLAGFSTDVRVILVALKRYGMILADNGTNWFVSGIPNEGWDNDLLAQLASVPGSAFEVVDVSSLRLGPDTGATPHLFSDGFETGATSAWSVTSP
ncbi:MAG TPA: hypothetical protein VLA66_04025 [Thermoanaerobaculia bacterium]|nr:hypothetical protein [Thermoanaerobaculia bacterium]